MNMTYVEKCLYDYPANTAKIELLNEELKLLKAGGDVQGISYEVKNNSQGAHSDPVSSLYLKLESIENKISKLMKVTRPVMKMYEVLRSPYALDGSRNSDYRKILELFYWGGNTVQEVLNHLGWSNTSFYERRKGLLNMALGYFNM